jgi:tetratricopeptide (TPR) repeat protein
MTTTNMDDPAELEQAAYAAYDAGQLGAAAHAFARLAALDPDHGHFHYMQGLAHKYRREWHECLAANLRAIALAPDDQPALWNAAIAATALGDWATARKCWRQAGVRIKAGKQEIVEPTATACVRLNAWSQGETVFAQRIGPARAMVLNVPLPESGYRYGDLVLNDGADTGWREL